MNIASYVDHTLLAADATQDAVEKLCDEAKTYSFASVCINPYWVPLAAQRLKDSGVAVCTVIGFPLGATSTVSKAAETVQAVADGATEVDMVLNIGALKSGDRDSALDDIQAVVAAAQGHALVKVIIETCLLTDEEKREAAQLVMEGGADFVKTSTGFSTGGATVDDVRLLKEVVGNRIKIKASGGIRTREDALKMIDAGAHRLGASAGIQFLQE